MSEISIQYFKNYLKKVIFVLALLSGLLHMYNSAFGTISAFQMRPLHLAIVGILAGLMDMMTVDKSKNPKLLVVMNVVVIGLILYGVSQILFNYKVIAQSVGKITMPIVICATALIVGILYLTTKKVGKALALVAFVFILYALYGHLIPGAMGHARYTFERVMYFLYTNGNGIFGVPIDTSSRYLVLFMIMGEFIELSGTSKLFTAIADYIASKVRGGAAKSSVVASALFGCISGTPIANVMVTGAFTIPMMKKSGFRDEFAAGVEATASTGGLIMPPMMGAGAFIMAELLGVGYPSIMLAALVPAILYYFSIYLSIDFYSAKHNITKVEGVDYANIIKRLKLYAHTIIPLITFIISVIIGYSVFRAAIVCILMTPMIAAIRKETRMGVKEIATGIANGMKASVSLGAACACAGIIVGIVSLTGFGFSFAELLSLFSNMPILALVITMLVCLVMGMGMPAVASYMITATIAAPSLINMGFMPIAVHMFIFFFSSFSSVTPPVALASYAAAGLARANPMRTGLEGFKLASVAFIVPYFFVYSPNLILQGGLRGFIFTFPAAIVGTFAFVCGLSAWFLGKNASNIIYRVLLIVGGALMIAPGVISDVTGFVILVITYFLTHFLSRRSAIEAQEK